MVCPSWIWTDSHRRRSRHRNHVSCNGEQIVRKTPEVDCAALPAGIFHQHGTEKKDVRLFLAATMLRSRIVGRLLPTLRQDDIAMVTASGYLMAPSMLLSLREYALDTVLLGVCTSPAVSTTSRSLAEAGCRFTMLSVVVYRPQHHPSTYLVLGTGTIGSSGSVKSTVCRGGWIAGCGRAHRQWFLCPHSDDDLPGGAKWGGEGTVHRPHRHRAEQVRSCVAKACVWLVAHLHRNPSAAFVTPFVT